jgi:guanosine-3',5'-bis(diphosphate) 3'-pyrophosphohydrolase
MTPEEITERLAIHRWPSEDAERGHRAARLAAEAYGGATRDQGTPYIHHPIAVTEIVRDEAGLTAPGLLVVALMHDALEIDPSLECKITEALGSQVTRALRALTPEHRLAGRPRGRGDDEAYHHKIRGLSDELLAVKLADRLHNLRDMANSSNPDRVGRFLTQLRGFYLPLARSRAAACRAIAALTRALDI